MPDISMCTGEGCFRKATCYRHTATPTPLRQSYFMTPPHRIEPGPEVGVRCGTCAVTQVCDYFWSTRRSGT